MNLDLTDDEKTALEKELDRIIRDDRYFLSPRIQTLREDSQYDPTGADTQTPNPSPLGNAAAARVRFIVWCLECRYQVEPDPAEMARRYGPETPVADWHKRLVCSRCGSHQVDMVVTRERR
jgi:hypothetical protein